MPNQLEKVIPQLLAQGLQALRENSIMPLLVNTMYEDMGAQKGSTIDVPIPSAIQAQEVQPSNVPPATPDIQPTSVPIPLSEWYEAPFYLTDKDMLEAMSGIMPMQASEAIKALANKVDRDLLSLYKGVYGVVGTPGVTPFASDTTDATNVRKVLNKQLAPLADRRIVIDPDAEANALNLRAFQDMSFSGSAMGIVDGSIERKLGFYWFMDQNVLSHTAGDASGYTVTGDQTAGTSIIPLGNGSGDFNVGDLITFAGHSQTYAVQAWDGSAVTVSPALKANVADAATVTLVDSAVVNLGFHRDAFAFVSRPLIDIETRGLGAITESVGDPVSGLTLRLEVTREHKRTRFSYDILYGVGLVRPELACRLLG